MKMLYGRAAAWLAVGIGAITATSSRSARAQQATPPATDEHRALADAAPADAGTRVVRGGVIGGIGFPRPLAIEPLAMIGGVVAAGVEYGVLPSTTINGVGVNLWSLAGDARVFPFGGAFFVGLRAGYQHIGASTTVTVAPFGSAAEELALDSWFLNPRIGLLWTSSAGLAFGVEGGVQIPVSTTLASTLPISLVPSAQSTANAFGSAILPTIDFLRVGLVL